MRLLTLNSNNMPQSEGVNFMNPDMNGIAVSPISNLLPAGGMVEFLRIF